MLDVEAQKAEIFSRAYTLLRDRGYPHDYVQRALDDLRTWVKPCAGAGGVARLAESWLSERAARGDFDVVEIYAFSAA